MWLRSEESADAITISVEDEGCGMDAATQNRMFDPFYTSRPIGQGTGMGLTVAYAIVRDHGGSITVNSSPGSGTRFTVRLPFRSTSNSAVTANQTAGE